MSCFRTLAAALALAATGANALAGPADPSSADLQTLAPAVQASALSRDEVRLELQTLQQAGLYQPVGEASPDALQAQRHADRVAGLIGPLSLATPSADGDTIVVPDHSMVIIEVVPADEPNPGEAMPDVMPAPDQ